MTERLYYEDAYLWDFEGTVTAVRKDDGIRVALDRSAFYPTSGGQPHDTGVLIFGDRKVRVEDVEADRDGVVWHRVDQEIPEGTPVRGVIDGERRTDHMEQHGGEHMLAGAIWEKLGGTTIGLHLGPEDSSIDVSMPDGRTHLTEQETEMLEETVNERIRLDAPIRCWFPPEEELKNLPLRKPPAVTGHVRIVSMGDFDRVACGGTCPIEKIASGAGELKARLAEAERKVNRFETERMLGEIRSNEEWDSLGSAALSVTLLEEGDARPASEAVSRYISEDGRVLLLSIGERLIFARSRDVDIDMNTLIRRVGRGGGRPDMASGAGIPQCAEVARKILITEGKNRQWRKKT